MQFYFELQPPYFLVDFFRCFVSIETGMNTEEKKLQLHLNCISIKPGKT